jgi:hypothetical protein
MTKKIAIIYTGESRTIESTIETFRQNLLLNENYHVFAVIQTSNNNLTEDLTEKLIKINMGNNLKSYENFNKNDVYWNKIQDDLLTIINTTPSWNEYLKSNSGSMVEYYQMYLAYQKIVEYEYKENFKYDYVIRIRCDVIITHPIYFDWCDFDEIYIKECFEEIQKIYNYEYIISIDSLVIFMNSIFFKNRIYSDIKKENKCILSTEIYANLLETTDENIFFSNLRKYINKGKFLITLRNNVVYFIKRKYMSCIAPLGITYGLYKNKSDEPWFNAENQLRQICIESDIDIFDSYTILEEKSLYEYDENNYYKDDNLIKNNDVFFFIKRK